MQGMEGAPESQLEILLTGFKVKSEAQQAIVSEAESGYVFQKGPH